MQDATRKLKEERRVAKVNRRRGKGGGGKGTGKNRDQHADSRQSQIDGLGGVEGIRRLRTEHKSLSAAAKALLLKDPDFAKSEGAAAKKLGDLAKLALVGGPDGTGLDEEWSVGVGYMPDKSGTQVKAVAFTAAAKKKEAAKAAKKRSGEARGAAKKRQRGGGESI